MSNFCLFFFFTRQRVYHPRRERLWGRSQMSFFQYFPNPNIEISSSSLRCSSLFLKHKTPFLQSNYSLQRVDIEVKQCKIFLQISFPLLGGGVFTQKGVKKNVIYSDIEKFLQGWHYIPRVARIHMHTHTPSVDSEHPIINYVSPFHSFVRRHRVPTQKRETRKRVK